MTVKNTITITLDSETANAIEKLSQDQKRKLELFLKIQAKNAIKSQHSLLEVMDEIGQEAEANGLTPEILESLLNNQ